MKKIVYLLMFCINFWNTLQAQIFQENFENYSPLYGTNVTHSGVCPSISFIKSSDNQKVDCLSNWKALKGTPSIGNENGNSFLELWSQNLKQNDVLKTFTEGVYLDGYRLEPETNYRLVYYVKANFESSNGYASFKVNLSNWQRPYYYGNSGDCGNVDDNGYSQGNLDTYVIPSNGTSDWVMRTVYFSTESEPEYFLSFMPFVWELNNPSKQLTVMLDNVQLYKEGVCENKTVTIQNVIISPRFIYPVVKAKKIYAGRHVVASSTTPFGDVVVKPNAYLNLYSTYRINLEDGFVVEEGGALDAYVDNGCYNLQSGREILDEEELEASSETLSEANVLDGTILSVYPNPSTGYFTIKSSSSIDEVVVYNSMGQEVKRLLMRAKDITLTEVDLLSSARGVYLVRIRSGNEWNEKKIIFNP